MSSYESSPFAKKTIWEVLYQIKIRHFGSEKIRHEDFTLFVWYTVLKKVVQSDKKFFENFQNNEEKESNKKAFYKSAKIVEAKAKYKNRDFQLENFKVEFDFYRLLVIIPGRHMNPEDIGLHGAEVFSHFLIVILQV